MAASKTSQPLVLKPTVESESEIIWVELVLFCFVLFFFFFLNSNHWTLSFVDEVRVAF